MDRLEACLGLAVGALLRLTLGGERVVTLGATVLHGRELQLAEAAVKRR